MKKTILYLFIMAISLVLMSSCKGNKKAEAEGYGITHEENVGIAKITVTNDTVDSVSFDEVYLPNIWAKIVKNTTVPEDVVSAGGNWYGKYIVIGDKHFTGTARTSTTVNGVDYPTQAVLYSADGIEDLYFWLLNSEDNCKWYVDQVLGDKAFVAKADWTKSDLPSAGKGGWTKSSTNYWPPEQGGLGWAVNMQKIAAALKGTKMDASNALTKTDDGWTVNGVQSGATATDFKDYYAVAKRAYDHAISQE